MSRKKMLQEYIIIHGACGLAFLSVLIYMILQHYGLVLKLPCVFLEATGLYCPGCGGTRALFALWGGHLLLSIKCNPAIVLGILVVGYYEIGVIRTIMKNDGNCYYNKKGIPLYIFLAIVMIFAIVRDVALVVYGIDMLN